MRYRELKRKHEKEINDFPMMFAFDNKQFIKGMEKLGLKEDDTDKICSIGLGGYVKKDDVGKLKDLINKQKEEFKNEVAADPTGDNFIYDMFNYELANHEYCITYDVSDALNSLSLTIDDVQNDSRLKHGLQKAIKNQREDW